MTIRQYFILKQFSIYPQKDILSYISRLDYNLIIFIMGLLKNKKQPRKEVLLMAGKNIHVVKNGDKWSVKQENAQKSSGNFSIQKDAFERAREIAKNNGQEVAIHGCDGKIREKHSYGEDPFPPKG